MRDVTIRYLGRPDRSATPPPLPERASLLTKAGRLRRELTAWARAGMPIAPRAVRRERLAICAACSYYDPAGNGGMGACLYPGCGCTRAKLYLATSRCPHRPPKWLAWPPPPAPDSPPIPASPPHVHQR